MRDIAPAVLKAIIFVVITAGNTWLSRHSLRRVQSHGFYRFFAWEAILLLFLINVDYWFWDPFSPAQMVSWVFLILSLVFIYQGVKLFRQLGKTDVKRNEPGLLGIEKTTELVTTGLYHYIRHPFYSSLLFLGWGTLLKHITWPGLLLAIAITLLLLKTAVQEEEENTEYFGDQYREYMKRTRRFVPFVF